MKRTWFSILLVVAALLAVVAQPVAASSSTVVISEFRTRGPNGADDQFIELYNLSASPIDIADYSISAWDAVSPVVPYDVIQISSPDGFSPVILQPYGHYLIVNGLGYSGSSAGDDSFFFPIGSNAVGLALIAPDGTTVVDAVSTTDAAPPRYKEGAVLAPLTTDANQSYARKPDTLSATNGHKNGVDTDVNTADFILVTSSPESWADGSGPTAVTLRDFSAQAQPSATWLPVALLVALSGAWVMLRRRRA